MTVPSRPDRRALWLAAFLALAPAAAQAEPRSIDDCEAIKQADAYNLCLARFGPAARLGGRSAPVPEGADPQPSAAPAESRPRVRHGRLIPPWLAARQAEGRRRMEARRRHSGIVVERKGARVRAVIPVRRR